MLTPGSSPVPNIVGVDAVLLTVIVEWSSATNAIELVVSVDLTAFTVTLFPDLLV